VTSSTRGRGLNTATRADLAEAAAAAIADPQSTGKAYDFTGRLWTFPELAEVLNEVSGRPAIGRSTATRGSSPCSVSAPSSAPEVSRCRPQIFEQVLGRPPTSLADLLGVADDGRLTCGCGSH
jgi:NAD(P)H dehydrogenase (quinone)